MVISKTVLYEWRPSDGSYDWLVHREPTGRVADSFWVYDLRARPQAFDNPAEAAMR